MFKHIMVPIDLKHITELEKALNVAHDLAKHYQAAVCYVSVTSTAPNDIAHTPEEYQTKLQTLADREGKSHQQSVSARVFTSNDPVADVDDRLVQAIEETGADLVVMATHLPRTLDAVMPAHGGKVATHTDASVLLVRP